MVQSHALEGKRFCGKTIPFNESQSVIAINADESCGDGYKDCGLEEPVCIKSNLKCPITSILFMSKTTFESSYKDQGYNSVDFDDLNIIAFSNAKGQPIT